MTPRRQKQPPDNQPHSSDIGPAHPADSGKADQPDDPSYFVLWMPAAGPRRIEHCVTFTQFAATSQARDGIYTALCAVLFAPGAPMSTPPWPHCPECTRIHRRWAESERQEQQRRRGPARLLPRRWRS
jgi:hypothetical protein